MSDRWRFWDWVMFSFAASLTLSPDLSVIEIAMLIVIVAGAALGSAE
ncbi:MAG TPA: hypothetical protein VK335_08495 [Bryobacteraceae bacterium]|nr:hypothetical protein [Bryobacteraceae bacterium]HXR15945.1 hypothetical protein [Terriglobales bacterium]HZW96153.1 hypothetical protein [Candidatus Eremiobacteraceae bacterium]